MSLCLERSGVVVRALASLLYTHQHKPQAVASLRIEQGTDQVTLGVSDLSGALMAMLVVSARTRSWSAGRPRHPPGRC
jgi:hypothetical protein